VIFYLSDGPTIESMGPIMRLLDSGTMTYIYFTRHPINQGLNPIDGNIGHMGDFKPLEIRGMIKCPITNASYRSET